MSDSAELEKLRKALPGAKAAVKGTPKVGNPALAPVMALMTLVSPQGKHEDWSVQHNLSLILLLIAATITGCIIYLSAEVGARAGPMLPPAPPEARRRAPKTPWLPPPEGSVNNPIPLQAEAAPRTGGLVVNYAGKRGPDASAIDRLMKTLEDEFEIKPGGNV